MVTPTMHHSATDRARLAVSPLPATPTMGGNWRLGSVAPTAGGTTGLFADVCSMDTTGTNRTAGADEQMIKRPARHLGTRST